MTFRPSAGAPLTVPPMRTSIANALVCALVGCTLAAGCSFSGEMVDPAPAADAPDGSQDPDDTVAEPCPTSDLAVGVTGVEEVAGSSYATVTMRNAGTLACTLLGYPGVSLAAYGPDGVLVQVGRAAAREPFSTKQKVTLAAGHDAHAPLRLADQQSIDAGVCDPAAVDVLQVIPPGQETAAPVEATAAGLTTTCSATVPPAQVLTIGPMVVGPPRGR